MADRVISEDFNATCQPRNTADRQRTSSSQGLGARTGPWAQKGDVIMRVVHGVTIGVMAAFCTAAHAQEIDWKKVDEALGKTAAESGEGHRYGLPRTDLNVTLDGVTIRHDFALGGWAAFAPMHGQA